MNSLPFNNAIEAQLATFFKKSPSTPEASKTRSPRYHRQGSKPNYYIYNSETQEVIELERQCSQADAKQAFTYLRSLTTPKSLTLWAVIGNLENTQALRYRKTYKSGDEFEITPNHPLKLALINAGYNFEKRKQGQRINHPKPALPKITLKVLGVQH